MRGVWVGRAAIPVCADGAGGFHLPGNKSAVKMGENGRMRRWDGVSRREWLAMGLGVAGGERLDAAGGGREYPQGRKDVSVEFAAGPGIRVTQITDSSLGNQLSYYDIPCYAPAAGRIVYNTVVRAPGGKPNKVKAGRSVWGVVACRLDGSDARLLATRIPPTTSTTRVDMSPDGKLVTYPRCNEDGEAGWDLYGLWLGDGREGQEFRITRRRTPVEATPKVKSSPACWDGRAGKYLCAYSIDDRVHLIYHDGTGEREAALTDLAEFAERRGEDTSFHRIRLNPVFPHLLYYRRNGVKDNWVVDLAGGGAPSRRISDYTASIHATWSGDGRTLAGSMHGPWVEWPVADGKGKLLPAFSARESGPFGRDGRPGIFYGCYSPDRRVLAVATRYDQEPGGSLWLLNTETGKAAYLCRARYFGPETAGQPRMGFAGDGRTLVFSSDNSHGRAIPLPPQVFIVGPLPGV